MRDLTEQEITEYLRWAKSDRQPQDFHQEQTSMVGIAARDIGLLNGLNYKILEGMRQGCSPEEIVLSMWVWGFQMGRECESRLLTQALKGKK